MKIKILIAKANIMLNISNQLNKSSQLNLSGSRLDTNLKNVWQRFNFKLNNFIVNELSIRSSLELFYNEHLSMLSDDDEFMIIFKVEIQGGPFRSISNLLGKAKT